MISIIVAIDQSRAIGKDNKLLWHISEDLRHFNAITRGHPVIMGRKTWESLPIKPLPNRDNIIITLNEQYVVNNAFIFHSLQHAIERIRMQKLSGYEEIFIIGGGQIYQQAMENNLVDRLYLTVVEGKHEADTYFPDYSNFTKTISEEAHQSEGHKFKFLVLEK
jgi:dihydrofolate reductase